MTYPLAIVVGVAFTLVKMKSFLMKTRDKIVVTFDHFNLKKLPVGEEKFWGNTLK